MSVPSPFVHWAQTEKCLSLLIDLKHVVNPDLVVLEDKVQFSADGVGAYGQCKYKFSLDLYSALEIDTSNGKKPATVRVLENGVDITLKKRDPAPGRWWPRLTAQPQNPAWLKVNFDIWKPEDLMDSTWNCQDMMKDNGMAQKLQKKKSGSEKNEIIKVYLLLFLLVQLVGYMYVLTVAASRYFELGYYSVTSAYDHIDKPIKVLQLMLFLDILHRILGWHRGRVPIAILQITGRVFTVFVILDVEPRLQSSPTVLVLYLAWSLVECVRCIYYITEMHNIHIGIVKWLRYSMWMVLYPCGLSCEALFVVWAVPYFEETKIWTVSLPNPWNFAFYMPNFLRLYALTMLRSSYVLMGHMYNQRKLKLSPSDVAYKCK